MTWSETTLGEVLPFKYGKNLPATKRSHSGEFDVVTSAGVVDSHFEPLVPLPSVVIGRKGTIGSLTYCSEPCWPTDTTFFTTGSDACDVRFGYYFLKTVPLAEMNNDSAVPGLNRGEAEALPIRIPEMSEQKRIGYLLGSLDDKIAANSHVASAALELQSAVWQAGTENAELIPLIEVAEPILGGTPPRKDEASWNGVYKWASVADMTASPRSHLLNTAERISDVAAKKKRFAPLPSGSVLLSARGTVGRVVSIVGPTSFNQSAYGFEAKPGFDAALRLAVMSAVNELRAKSYGSVFSTITKAQIQEALVPSVFSDHAQPLHQKLNALESLIVALEIENRVLAKTRDELLPLLMSGKITVKEAEQEATAAGADITSEENKA